MSLDALQAREDLILNQLRSVDATAVSNIAAFTQSLRRIGERLLNHPIGYVYGLAFSKETKPKTTEYGGVDRALMRYSAKLGLAATFGVCRWRGVTPKRAQRHRVDGADSRAADLWGNIAQDDPAHRGGSDRRSAGAAGHDRGLAQLLVARVVPAAFFVVLFICAYVSLSSGRLAYAGQQAASLSSWRMPL